MDHEIGRRFAEAMAKKDRDGLLAVLDPALDVRALTPGRCWEPTSATEFVDDVVLGAWFEPADHIDELVRVETDDMADRIRVSYRFHVTNGDGTFLVEQQAYVGTTADRIDWLRILCSGFRPAG